MAKNEKIWQPNETQAEFLKVLEEYPDGITLVDLQLDKGLTFKTGSVNVLVSKGLVETADGEFVVETMYRGHTIGKITKKWKIYKLASK